LVVTLYFIFQRSLLGPCRLWKLWQQAASNYQQPLTTQHGIISQRLEPLPTLLSELQILQKHTLYHAVFITVTLPSEFQDFTVRTNVTKA